LTTTTTAAAAAAAAAAIPQPYQARTVHQNPNPIMAVKAQPRTQPTAFFPTPGNHVVQEEEDEPENDEPEDDEQTDDMEDELPARDGPPPGNGPFDSKTEFIGCEFEDDWRCNGCRMVKQPVAPESTSA